MTSHYVLFPASETIELAEISDIRSAVDKALEAYVSHINDSNFSLRILLPRGEKLTGRAKKLGITFQGEFLIGLRRRNLSPQVREVRYLHDERHYGWLLANPSVFEQFDKKR